MNEEYMDSLWEDINKMFADYFDENARSMKGVYVAKELWKKNKAWMMPYFDDQGRRFIETEISETEACWILVENAVRSLSKMISNMLEKDQYRDLFSSFCSDQAVEDISSFIIFVLRNLFSPEEIFRNEISTRRSVKDKQFDQGTKVTKVFREGVINSPNWQRPMGFKECKMEEVAEFCVVILSQVISQLKTKSCTVALSINPIDMLFSSVHTTGWRSCHNIFDGEWKCGPLAYTIDDCSAIAYAFDTMEDFKPKDYFDSSIVIPKVPVKIWRQMVYLDKVNHSAVMSREYPSNMPQLSASARNLAAWVLSEKAKVPHDWLYKEVNSNNEERFILPSKRWNYIDSSRSIIKLKEIGSTPEVEPGRNIIPCLVCGEERDDGEAEYLDCGHCFRQVGHRGNICENCGRLVRRGFFEVIDGDIYCEDCVNDLFYLCQECGEYIRSDDVIWTAEDDPICYNCYSQSYITCQCDAVVKLDDAFFIEDEGYSVCEDCFEEYYGTCNNCYKNMDAVYLETVEDCGGLYCSDCYSVCENCGRRFLDSHHLQKTEDSGLYRCENCRDTCKECGKSFAEIDSSGVCDECSKIKEERLVASAQV